MILEIYLLIVNLVAFCTYGIDKSKAERGSYRIPEKTLIGLALLGGSLGAFLGMRVFHHKTRKPKFYITVPLLLVLDVALYAYYYFHMAT